MWRQYSILWMTVTSPSCSVILYDQYVENPAMICNPESNCGYHCYCIDVKNKYCFSYLDYRTVGIYFSMLSWSDVKCVCMTGNIPCMRNIFFFPVTRISVVTRILQPYVIGGKRHPNFGYWRNNGKKKVALKNELNSPSTKRLFPMKTVCSDELFFCKLPLFTVEVLSTLLSTV